MAKIEWTVTWYLALIGGKVKWKNYILFASYQPVTLLITFWGQERFCPELSEFSSLLSSEILERTHPLTLLEMMDIITASMFLINCLYGFGMKTLLSWLANWSYHLLWFPANISSILYVVLTCTIPISCVLDVYLQYSFTPQIYVPSPPSK